MPDKRETLMLSLWDLIFGTLPIILSLIWFIILVVSPYFWLNNINILLSWKIFSLNRFTIDFPISFDPISLLFLIVVCWISHSVFIFARWYIGNDPSFKRFYQLLILFVLSMGVFIIIPHLIRLFLGWDGLGIRRFLLILHYQSHRRWEARVITIVFNRFGDALLLIAVCCWSTNGQWFVFRLWKDTPILCTDIRALLLLSLAAFTKRAQIPFNLWLPEAMEAPTPVSALVHSSTLVTAGVYLLIRTQHIWGHWSVMSRFIFITGLISLIVGGRAAVIELDVKKTIAYSTLSQVGFIIIVLGMGYPLVSYFHLLTHALFKATLFISAGCVFKYNHHYQTFENHNSKWYTPIVGVGLTCSLLSMNVFPFFSGIYSKELLINGAHFCLIISANHLFLIIFIIILLIGSVLTSVYSTRIWIALWKIKHFIGPHKAPSHHPIKYNKEDTNITGPIIRITSGSVSLGSIVFWITLLPPDTPVNGPWVKIVTICCAVAGIGAALRVSQMIKKTKSEKLHGWETKEEFMGYHALDKFSDKLKVTQIYNNMPFFEDRIFYPIYRILFLCRRFVFIIEAGLISFWLQIRTSQLLYPLSSTFSRSRPMVSFFLILFIVSLFILYNF